MAATSDPTFGPMPPYGVAIREAAATGDEALISQTEQAAQDWLRANPGHESEGEVQAALRELHESRG